MKKTILIGALALALGACSTTSQKNEAQGQIDIVPAFENPTELKVSHLGKNIRYVPLETTDSSLVIDYVCKVKQSGDKIIVTYRMKSIMHCFLFDGITGKFIREIGHPGEGPRDYSEPKAYIHPVTGNIYFHKIPNKLIKYNQEGDFLGEVVMPNGLPSGFYPLLTQDGMLVYEEDANNPIYQKILYYLDETQGIQGNVNLQRRPNNDGFHQEKYHSYSLFKNTNTHGLLSYTGAIKVVYKDETLTFFARSYPALWYVGNEFHFHEPLSDTIFQVKDHELTPYRIFNLGERRMSEAERGKKEGNEEKLTVTYVLETADLLFFQCAKNLYNIPTIYNGLYRKKDGVLTMNKAKDGFKDDLTGFLPFHPKTQTDKGGFMGILKVEEIHKWIEEHPEVKLEGALAPLKNLADDANPVVVIVEP